MKGQKIKDLNKHHKIRTVNSEHNTELRISDFVILNPQILFTYLDLVPIDFTPLNVMDWLANTGWIEGLIIKLLGDKFPYLDDYILEIYLLIFEKIDKLIDVYETRGILAFCGYVKVIIWTNCKATTTKAYNNIRRFPKDIVMECDTETWNDILDTYNPDTNILYKMNKTNDLR